jgi:hypothetical protein
MADDDSTYGFSKPDAESLLQSIGGADGQYGEGTKRQQVVHRIFKTPVGGIPARVAAACGTADCTEYYVDSDGDIVVTGNGDFTVTNIFATAIEAEVYITAKFVRGRLIADAEDCGSGN